MACLVGGGQPAWTALLAADGLPSYAGALAWWPGGRRPWCPLQGRAHAGAAAVAPLVLFFSRFLLRMLMREREREGAGGGLASWGGEESRRVGERGSLGCGRGGVGGEGSRACVWERVRRGRSAGGRRRADTLNMSRQI